MEAGHLAELALERSSHRRRHHVGAGAGIDGRDLDGRIVDFGERRDRKLLVRDEPASTMPSISSDVATGRRMKVRDGFMLRAAAGRSAAGRDRRGIIVALARVLFFGHETATLLPACSRSTPSITINSCGEIPETTSERWSSVVPILTFRIVTDWSVLTT